MGDIWTEALGSLGREAGKAGTVAAPSARGMGEGALGGVGGRADGVMNQPWGSFGEPACLGLGEPLQGSGVILSHCVLGP